MTRKRIGWVGYQNSFTSEKRFQTNESNVVVIEIAPDGKWGYLINGIREASGAIAGGFDLSKSYRVVVYGQDDHGDGKAIQHISLELNPTSPL